MNEKNKKPLEDNQEETEIKVTFSPGCFDNFEGTQEELDELVKSITQQVTQSIHNGTIDLQSTDIDFSDDEFFDDHLTDEEILEFVQKQFNDPKKLN
jgi:hypothetical protein